MPAQYEIVARISKIKESVEGTEVRQVLPKPVDS